MRKKLKPFLPLLIIFTVCIASYNIIEIFIHLNVKKLIDEAVVAGNISGLNKIVPAMLLLYAAYIPVLLLGFYLRNVFIRRLMGSLKKQYVNRLFQKNINEFQKENNAGYLSVMTNDFELMDNNFLTPLLNLIAAFLNFAAGISLVIIVNPWILLLMLAVSVIMLFVGFLTARPLSRRNKEKSDMLSGYTAYIKEVLSAFHIIKTNDLHDRIAGNYNDKVSAIQNKSYEIDKIITVVSAIENAGFMFIFIGLFAAMVYLNLKGFITLGGVILIFDSVNKLISPIDTFSEELPKMFSVKDLYNKIEHTLLNENDYVETKEYPGLSKTITLNNVKFSYGGNIILENVSACFEKGGKYLIVGPSGGGKSTLLRLLRKYFNPDEGVIMIDSAPLSDIQKNSYFSHIANIEQNIFIFEDTIKNNLTLYKDYSDDDIRRALELAGLGAFVSALPDGLETVIYDNGKNISGGERSRIAIARGLLNKSDIMFLDEPFANLDTDTARAIEKSILALRDITIINVSHVIFKENRNLYTGCFLVKDKTLAVYDNT